MMLVSVAAATPELAIDWFKWMVTTFLSAIAALLPVIALWKNSQDSKRAREENSARTRHQYNAEIRSWADDCIATLSDAVSVARHIELDGARLSGVTSKLSAKADQGRFFFPNPDSGAHDQDSEKAFRGYRPQILDWLIFAFDICRSIRATPDKEAEHALFLMQRGFTSDAQTAIDPRNPSPTMEDLKDLLRRGSERHEFLDTSQSHKNLLAVRPLIDSRAGSLERISPVTSDLVE
jgi:hypothetical protein